MTSGRVLYEIFVAAFERGPAEIRGGEMAGLEHGAHGAIEHENPAFQGIGQSLLPLFETVHCLSILEGPRSYPGHNTTDSVRTLRISACVRHITRGHVG